MGKAEQKPMKKRIVIKANTWGLFMTKQLQKIEIICSVCIIKETNASQEKWRELHEWRTSKLYVHNFGDTFLGKMNMRFRKGTIMLNDIQSLPGIAKTVWIASQAVDTRLEISSLIRSYRESLCLVSYRLRFSNTTKLTNVFQSFTRLYSAVSIAFLGIYNKCSFEVYL